MGVQGSGFEYLGKPSKKYQVVTLPKSEWASTFAHLKPKRMEAKLQFKPRHPRRFKRKRWKTSPSFTLPSLLWSHKGSNGRIKTGPTRQDKPWIDLRPRPLI